MVVAFLKLVFDNPKMPCMHELIAEMSGSWFNSDATIVIHHVESGHAQAQPNCLTQRHLVGSLIK